MDTDFEGALIVVAHDRHLLSAATDACYSLPSPQGWADPVFDGNTIYYSPTAGKLEAYDRSAQKTIWDFPNGQN